MLLIASASSANALHHQAPVPEHPGNHWIADLRHALFHLRHGKTRQQDARTFNLDSIIKKGDAQRAAAMGIVGMHQRINYHFTKNIERNAPNILVPDFGEIGSELIIRESTVSR
jgi:hypothetical protein